MSKYGVFPSPYFPVFGLNTEIYGPDKTPYLDNFHAVKVTVKLPKDLKNLFLLIFLLEFKWTSCSYFVKMLLIEAFITAQNFDIIYLPETFIDSSIDISDIRINLNGYSLL